jgi:type VI secretion system ImpC/EvpB family protein/type VI secretion system ImpB/VipA family protein
MGEPITFESIDVSLSTSLKNNREKPQSDTPFKLVIMGDFGGRANRGEETDGSDIDQRKLFRVDRDNDEAVMEKMNVSVRLQTRGNTSPPVHLAFCEMDDFHPEQIYFRTDLFKSMKATRRRLMDADTFAETAAWLSGTAPEKSADRKDIAERTPAAKAPDFAGETTAGLLDQVLDVSSTGPSGDGKALPQTDWDRFLGDIVGPHLVPDIEKEQDAMVAVVDRAISETMRSILHHRDFQAIESAWRGLQFCLRRLETDETLQVYLLDVTVSELAADLTAHEDLRDTALYKKLASASQASSGQAPWSVLAGMFTASPTKMDAVLLARLGALGQMLGAPVIAGADAGFVGCPSFFESPDPSDWTAEINPADRQAWDVLRTLPEAAWIGLALPRFLIRLPYGENTDPVDAFFFEEMPDPAEHEHYLWVNPVFALVLVLGRTFTRQGWNWSQGLINALDGLPLHLFSAGDEPAPKPCAEAFLSQRAIEKIIRGGFMPLASYKDQGRIQLVRFQSIAEPLTQLSGRWNR